MAKATWKFSLAIIAVVLLALVLLRGPFHTGGEAAKAVICGDAICERGEKNSCPGDCSAALQPNTITLVPIGSRFSTGELIPVAIRISQASDIYGFQLDVVYDPIVLRPEAVTEGGYLSADGAETFFVQADLSTPGRIANIAAVRLGQTAATSPSGDLAVVQFRALTSSSSALRLENVILTNAQSTQLPFAVQSATLKVR